MIHVCITSCGRTDATLRLLKSLQTSQIDRSGAIVHLLDVSTPDDFVRLIDDSGDLLDDARIIRVPPTALSSDVYWSKNLLWAMFVCSFAPASRAVADATTLVMLDNDVEITTRPWTLQVIRALDRARARWGEPVIVDMMSGKGAQPDDASDDLFIRSHALSRFWCASLTTWSSMQLPTWRKIERNGRDDRMPTDAHYWKEIAVVGGQIVAIDPPIAIDQNIESKRAELRIGADVQTCANGTLLLLRRKKKTERDSSS